MLWLPSLHAGMNYDKHEGYIQQVTGQVIEVSRSGFFGGAGAGVVGSGTAAIPGVYANFQMADAIFLPLAAQQAVGVQRSAASAVTNDILLQVSQGYSKLLQAAGDVVIAMDAQHDADELAVLTKNYAITGQGLQSDADRAGTELAIRRNEVIRAETLRAISTQLVELLRLDPRVKLSPLDPAVVPLELVKPDSPVGELISQALTCRPELAEARYLVGVAVEQNAPRTVRDAAAQRDPRSQLRRFRRRSRRHYRQLGWTAGGRRDRLLGDTKPGLGRARGAGRGSLGVAAAHIGQVAAMDHVARQVTEAQIQLASRAREIPHLQEAVVSATASQN